MVVFDICCLNIAIIPIIYALDYYDITAATLLGCQTQFYFRDVCFQMLRTAKVMAYIDRYAICRNNSYLRSLSHPKVAIKILLIAFIVCGRW